MLAVVDELRKKLADYREFLDSAEKHFDKAVSDPIAPSDEFDPEWSNVRELRLWTGRLDNFGTTIEEACVAALREQCSTWQQVAPCLPAQLAHLWCGL